MKQEHPEARMILVGSGDPGGPASIPESQLHAWARSGGRVVRPAERHARRARRRDRGLPANLLSRGIPRVLIEAAACGQPVSRPTCPAAAEIVRDGENGLLVPVKNPVALAAAIAVCSPTRPV